MDPWEREGKGRRADPHITQRGVTLVHGWLLVQPRPGPVFFGSCTRFLVVEKRNRPPVEVRAGEAAAHVVDPPGWCSGVSQSDRAVSSSSLRPPCREVVLP